MDIFSSLLRVKKRLLLLWEYSKRFHCSFEWHLTPHMTLSIKTFAYEMSGDTRRLA